MIFSRSIDSDHNIIGYDNGRELKIAEILITAHIHGDSLFFTGFINLPVQFRIVRRSENQISPDLKSKVL